MNEARCSDPNGPFLNASSDSTYPAMVKLSAISLDVLAVFTALLFVLSACVATPPAMERVRASYDLTHRKRLMLVKGIAQQDPMGSEILLRPRSNNGGGFVVGTIASVALVASVIAMLTVVVRVRRQRSFMTAREFLDGEFEYACAASEIGYGSFAWEGDRFDL